MSEKQAGRYGMQSTEIMRSELKQWYEELGLLTVLELFLPEGVYEVRLQIIRSVLCECGLFVLFANLGVTFAESKKMLLFGCGDDERIHIDRSTRIVSCVTRVARRMGDVLLRSGVESYHGHGAVNEHVFVLDSVTILGRLCNLHGNLHTTPARRIGNPAG